MTSAIETIDLPELVAIGIPVDALWSELPVEMPKAWHRLFELNTGATSFLGVSFEREFDMYHELVGYLAAKSTDIPDGLVRIVIPPRRYLRLIHDGPLDKITEGFERIYHSATVQGLHATDLKLDFGYAPGLPPGRHELHVAITTPRGLLG